MWILWAFSLPALTPYSMALLPPPDVVHLKIDTQGRESDVILGADAVLHRIVSVRMEVAVSEVYAGETPLPEAIKIRQSVALSDRN